MVEIDLCKKPLAVKDYPSSVVVFLDQEQLARVGPPPPHPTPRFLSNPFTLPPASPPRPLPVAV